MKNKRSYQRAIAAIAFAVLAVLVLSAVAVLPASANSGPKHWRGTSGTGAMVGEGSCPLVVEHETLTFDVPEFPSTYYDNVEDFLAYGAKVTAEYTFYNPTDMTVTAKLLFPYGVNPDYGGYFYDGEGQEYVDVSDKDKYGAQINGKDVQTAVRHSYPSNVRDFDPSAEMSRLRDTFVTDGFLHPDLPVQIYTYAISGVDIQTYRAARVGAYFDYDPGKTMVMLQDQLGGKISPRGTLIGAAAASTNELVLYVFGEDAGQVNWKFYENGAMEKEIDGELTLISKQSTTFGALALQGRAPKSEISEVDWFNAVVACVEDNRWNDTCVYRGMMKDDWNISGTLLEWFEYEITLAPGQRLINTVTAPLYPDIDDHYTPTAFTYLYLLSPASLWADFGTLDIYINTPYYLVDAETSIAVDAYTKTDTGYALHLDGLPEQDLEFSLSTEEKVTEPGDTLIMIILVILGVVLLVVIATILIVVAVMTAIIAFLMLLSVGGAVMAWFWLPWIALALLAITVISTILGIAFS